MRYAKISTADGPLYVHVEDRAGALWAAAPMAAPIEDALDTTQAAALFRPGPLDSFTLLAPVRPSKIVCVGRNYRDHATELGNEVPREPLLFLKPPSALLAPGGTVVMPALSKRIDFEGELAIVIGRRCRNIGEDEDARTYIRGYTLVNDVTARDIQKSDGQWTRGKGFDTFCPAGPIVSDEIDPSAGQQPVTVTTRLNGEVRQTGSTADLIFSIPFLLGYISACMTLEPGDLIPTGTPAGVGPMHAGDEVEVEIPGLGILRNTLAAEG
jgi:2-keto-4-pentenoate hydratase/2-oxohepta-3-ene-1,7-dioic acid hydratase in catechol pathway